MTLAAQTSDIGAPIVIRQPADLVSPMASTKWWESGKFDVADREYFGAGVSVGVVDDGIHYTHTDLAGAYDASRDRDFADGDLNAFASAETDYHGTGVAGVISASPGGQTPTGGAYEADLVSYRISYSASNVHGQIAQAFDAALHDDLDVVNASFGAVGFFTGDPKFAYARSILNELEEFAHEGRDGLGGVVVFSAGNDARVGNDADLHSYQNTIHSIAVGGYDAFGRDTSYAQAGECLLLSAQSSQVLSTSGSSGRANWTGTSFSAPQVSAIVALMYEANAELGARDVKEILAMSADHDGVGMGPRSVDDYDFNGAATWNGGAMHFDRDIGFGFADARAAVRLAEHWNAQRTFADMLTEEVGVEGGAIADGGVFETTFRVEQRIDLDMVELDIRLRHGDWSEVKIDLISADGTVASIMDGSSVDWTAYSGHGSGVIDWSFTANRFWGEIAHGEWTLRVTDLQQGGSTGVVERATLSAHGDLEGDRQFVFTDELSELGEGRDRLEVWGSGREDTLNAAAVTSNSNINLNPGATTVVDGVSIGIAAGSKIENAVGGDGADRIRGNYLDNWLHGGRGDDVLFGHRGENVLEGGQGRDGLIGGRGVDYFTFDDVAKDGWDRVMGFEVDKDMIDLRKTFADWDANTDWSRVIKTVQKGAHVNLYADFDFDDDGRTADDVMIALIRNVDVDDLAVGQNVLVA